MIVAGHRKEDKFWAATLTTLGQRLGVAEPKVETRSTCVDSRRQWRHARNVWHNSMVRSMLQTLAAPVTGARRTHKHDAFGSDAVVVGSGPNGLAAALTWRRPERCIVEGAPTIGGGCRTEELTLPGFFHDVCSAAHPLAVASPFFQRFGLTERGVTLALPEVEFAHPLDRGRAAI